MLPSWSRCGVLCTSARIRPHLFRLPDAPQPPAPDHPDADDDGDLEWVPVAQQFPAFGVFPEMQGILIFRFVNATGKMLTWTPQFIPQAKGLAGHGSLCQEGTCQEGTQESLR